MARNQTSKPSKVEQDEEEEEQIHVKEEVIEGEEEKSLLVRSIPQPSRLVEEGSIRSSVQETLTLPSPLSLQGNERNSSDCRRSFSNPLTGAVPSPANSASGGPEATSVPVFMISGESTAEACRRFLSGSEATPVPVFTISGESTAEACRSFLSGVQVGVSVSVLVLVLTFDFSHSIYIFIFLNFSEFWIIYYYYYYS